jgi:hypothetical protein
MSISSVNLQCRRILSDNAESLSPYKLSEASHEAIHIDRMRSQLGLMRCGCVLIGDDLFSRKFATACYEALTIVRNPNFVFLRKS